MLKKSQRLERKEFQSIFQSARAFPFKHFIIKYKPSTHPFFRVGISCGLKVSKKAVVRNRIRRILYRSVQDRAQEVPKGDYIVIVKPLILTVKPSLIQDIFLKALASIHEARAYRSH